MKRTLLVIGSLCQAGWVLPLSGQAICPRPWALEQVLEIGAPGGPVDFTGILDMTVARDGRIYVTQSFTPMVTVLTPEGRPDRTMGRVGQGPGEFRITAINVGFLGDSVWATDVDGLEVFAPDGRPAYGLTFRTAVPNEGSTFNPGVPLPDGGVLGAREINNSTEYYERDRFPLLRFSRAGEIRDTIATIPRPFSQFYVEVVEGTRTSHPGHPLYNWVGQFQDMPVALSPDRASVVLIDNVRLAEPQRTLLNPLARVTSGSFDLIRISTSGDTLLRRRVSYEPKPVTREDADRIRELFAGGRAGDFGTSSRPNPFESDSEFMRDLRRKAARDALELPEHYPPVRGLIAGVDGSFWLLRELRMDGTDLWEVYGGDGELLGSVQSPSVAQGDPRPWLPRFTPLRASRTELWGVTRDALDVQLLRKYRVRNPCA